MTTDDLTLTISQSELYMSSKVVVTIYSILFVISAIGNTTVFISLVKNRNRKLRINLLILNLTIGLIFNYNFNAFYILNNLHFTQICNLADLIVTYVMIPMEVSCRTSVEWS